MTPPPEDLIPPVVQNRLPDTLGSRLKRLLTGGARDFRDPSLRHKISLMAFMAWVGLGADGLTSSAYGPEEAFRTLGSHTYLALLLAVATALTVFIISFAYSRIIEHFPQGGGGYLVATQLLGRQAGVVSGCALLVDYVLTIAVSIAGGGDAIFSLLPPAWQHYKLAVEFAAVLLLIAMNLRGVKESVTLLVPIFLTFVVTHVVLIFGGILLHLGEVSVVHHQMTQDFHQGLTTLGVGGMFVLFLRSYSMGAGTYTGIEAVSNGLGIMREPRVQTGKRTMIYMASSLAVTAGGLLVCYMLFHVHPIEDRSKTLNALLAESLASAFRPGGLPIGPGFVLVTLFSEAILLLVAAQTGFIDGPRVMANMAVDSWLPRRFAMLSDRLTTQNGVLLMGVAAMATLGYTHGRIGPLVIMYSINVFLTFSLSQAGMVRFWVRDRKTQPKWKRNVSIHAVGLVLCLSILGVMLVEKLSEGGWITVAVTTGLILLCFAIRRHYRGVSSSVKMVDDTFARLPSMISPPAQCPPLDPAAPTAVLLVGGYGGLGIHMLLTIQRLFPNTFSNFVFAGIGVIDSAFFQHEEGVDAIGQRTQKCLEQYAQLACRMGKPTDTGVKIGTDVVEEASAMALEIAKKYPRAVFFAGTVVFERPHWYDRFLHNETAYAIQRRLKSVGLPLVILPLMLQTKK